MRERIPRIQNCRFRNGGASNTFSPVTVPVPSPSRSIPMRTFPLVTSLLLSACALPAVSSATTPSLVVAAESDGMIWNGVALSDEGQVFVAGPRWTGSTGPALGVLDARGQPHAYPDVRWNAWQPGQDASAAFVNINAIHKGPQDSLWVIDTGSPDFGGAPLPGGA